MDAAGNITDASEFGNRRFRLISYLDPDAAVGVIGGEDVYTCRVHRLSSGNPILTIFRGVFTVNPPWFVGLRFAWDRVPSYTIDAAPDGSATVLKTSPISSMWVTPLFVNGPWFLLADRLIIPGEGYRVLDCSESDTSESNPILWWERNDGDNQKWRAATAGLDPVG
jgi:hypothetical protein